MLVKTIKAYWNLTWNFLCRLREMKSNPDPFGIELGTSSIDDAMRILMTQTKVEEGGVNAYSEGLMLKSNGDGLQIENLREITFIFDKEEKFCALLLVFKKEIMNHAFRNLLNILRKKYEVEEICCPPVGTAYARLGFGGCTIELDSPHFSSFLELRYATKSFMKQFMLMNNFENVSQKPYRDQPY